MRQANHVDEEGIEREAQERLLTQLAYVRALEKRAEGRGHWDLAAPGSALESDDKVLRPFQLSHFIGHCLASSIDAMRTTRLVMQEHEGDTRLRLPLMGLYPVLRASSEAGALAVWMLQPEDARERRLRALQARWEDVLHADKAAQILFSDPLTGDKRGTAYQQAALRDNAKSIRSRKRELRDLGLGLGIPSSAFERGLPGFGPIMGFTASTLGMKASTVRSTWHTLSGLSHPGVARAVMFSQMAERGEAEGVIRGHFTARPSVVGQAIDSAVIMYTAALDLCAERGGDSTIAFSTSSADRSGQ